MFRSDPLFVCLSVFYLLFGSYVCLNARNDNGQISKLQNLNIPDKSDGQVSYAFGSRHGVDCVPLQPFILGYSSACYHSSEM
jgi:hypothetical protein